MQYGGEKGFYTDGITTQPLPCQYTLSDEVLCIYLTENENKLLIWNVSKINSVSSSDDSLLFEYTTSEALIGKGVVANALADTIKLNKENFKKKQGLLTKGALYMIIGVCAFFLVLTVLAYLYVLPWVGEKAVSLVPVDTEIEMGKSLSNVYTSETTTNDSANVYLAQFVKQLKLEATYPLEVRVINSEEINAFALPGGRIYIYSALLQKLETPEELVALLGHEVSHVSQRHSLKSMARALASSILISVVLGDASGLGSGIMARANEFKQLDYSRELETDADLYGLDLMVKNRVHPKGMQNLLYKLKTENEETPQLMKYLSTHPETEERIARVKQQKNAQLSFEQNETLLMLFQKIKQCFPNDKES